MSTSGADVRTGIWTNWDKGKVYGLTITLETDYAVFLNNFIAIFITWAGTHLWSIMCFVMMQSKSTKAPRDALHHQKQAILRNSPAVGGTMWSFVKQAYAWRHSAKHPVRRTLPVILLAIAHVLGFTSAGVFSSRVSSPGGEVLLYPGKCGFSLLTNESITISLLKDNALARESVVYTRNCFQDGGADGKEDRRCLQYTTPRIGGDPIVDTDAPCPFPDAKMCKAPAIRIETNIGSSDLGINVPIDENIWLKKITTWSPLEVKDHTGAGWTRNPPFGDDISTFYGEEKRKYFFLGNMVYNETYTLDWVHGTRSLFFPDSVDPYKLTPVTSLTNNAAPEYPYYEPIPELDTRNGDVNLLFVSSIVIYNEQVNDPLYAATEYTVDSTRGTGYFPDEPVTVLGVTESYQICTHNSCGPITGIADDAIWSDMVLTKNQYGVAYRLRRTAAEANVFWITRALGAGALLTPDYRASDLTYLTHGLPDKQWQTDAHNLHNISLAMMQRLAVEYASHPRKEVTPGSGIYGDSSVQDPLTITDTPFAGASLKRLCDRQKIRSYRYSSFSVLGVGLILGIGTAIILLNCTLADLVACIRARKSSARSRQKRAEWAQTELLQLQRMALDARGIGPWTGEHEAVPMPVDLNLKWSISEEAGAVRRRRNSETTLTPGMESEGWAGGWGGLKGAHKYQSVGEGEKKWGVHVAERDLGYNPYRA